MTSKILIVDDEQDIIDLITFHVKREGFEVHALTTGAGIVEQVLAVSPHLIVLDLMLPGQNGFDCCKKLKAEPKTQAIPIIMLSAKNEDSDIVTGLELGADDYLPKPFSPKVLVARIRALLRRHPENEGTDHQNTAELPSEWVIDPHAMLVKYQGHSITLSASEFKALEFLAQKPGWVFSRYQIVEAIRGEHYIVTDRTVDVLIVGLRKKLGAAGHFIETVRGVGYRFKSS
jgi:two-component system alkaline phosphatase synthesis response regulator PhoP